MSIPNSIAGETGFALIDVADSIRNYPEIINYLKNPNDETFFEDIAEFEGGETACESIANYLSKYGMRCSGDIDITNPRWSEKPSDICPAILSNIKNYGQNGLKLKFDQGVSESMQKIEDIYYLSFDELRKVVNTGRLDYHIIVSRREDYNRFEKLTPPRIITSDGEIISGAYDTADMPENALPGLAVSDGIIEGRARVISSFDEAYLDEGDILVTEFTDPSWTPLFVSIKGLVTEVGGLVTHGAIIAREYGLHAVVSVENATKLIRDGQMIRVNGTEGYI